MTWSHWLNALCRSLPPPPPSRSLHRRHSQSRRIEPLEQRLVLSAISVYEDMMQIYLAESASFAIVNNEGYATYIASDYLNYGASSASIDTSAISTIQIIGGTGDNVIDLQDVDLSLFPNLTAVSVDGGAGDDQIFGSALGDVLFGGSGNDWVYSVQGNDTVTGDAGSDTLYSGAGYDTISGGADDDSINGQSGIDCVSGGSGDDTVVGGGQADSLYGGDGIDSFGDFPGSTGYEVLQWESLPLEIEDGSEPTTDDSVDENWVSEPFDWPVGDPSYELSEDELVARPEYIERNEYFQNLWDPYSRPLPVRTWEPEIDDSQSLAEGSSEEGITTISIPAPTPAAQLGTSQTNLTTESSIQSTSLTVYATVMDCGLVTAGTFAQANTDPLSPTGGSEDSTIKGGTGPDPESEPTQPTPYFPPNTPNTPSPRPPYPYPNPTPNPYPSPNPPPPPQLPPPQAQLPVVTIQRGPQHPVEGIDPGRGYFTITRTGSTAQPLQVNLQYSGSAGRGTDYNADEARQAVTIPTGMSSQRAFKGAIQI